MASRFQDSNSKLPHPKMAKALSNFTRKTKEQLKPRYLFTINHLHPRNQITFIHNVQKRIEDSLTLLPTD